MLHAAFLTPGLFYLGCVFFLLPSLPDSFKISGIITAARLVKLNINRDFSCTWERRGEIKIAINSAFRILNTQMVLLQQKEGAQDYFTLGQHRHFQRLRSTGARSSQRTALPPASKSILQWGRVTSGPDRCNSRQNQLPLSCCLAISPNCNATTQFGLI